MHLQLLTYLELRGLPVGFQIFFYFTIISSAISCCITLQIRDTAIFINQRLIVSTIFLHMSNKCLTASMIFTKSIFWLCIWSFFYSSESRSTLVSPMQNSTSAFQSVALVERIFFFLSNHRPLIRANGSAVKLM